MTLTSYCPSPRGVYAQLRVGGGTYPTPTGSLHVIKPTNDGNLAFRVDDEQPNDLSPFVIDQTGNVGIGTASPAAKLDVSGGGIVSGGSVRVGQLNADPSGGQNGAIYYNTASNSFRGLRNGAWQDLGLAPGQSM